MISIYEEDNIDSILTETEVPIYGSGKIGTYYPDQNGSAAYEITDHLGNVRALVRDNVSVYTATMEDDETSEIDNPRVEEMLYFENLFETEVTDSRMNHTKPGGVAVPDKAAYLYWVSGMTGIEATDKAVGPAIALKVSAGDTVKMEAWARYENKVSYNRNFPLTTLASLLGGSFAYTAGFEGSTIAQTTSAFNGALGAAGFMGDGADGTRPFAYLNYILFDQNMAMTDAGWERVPETAGFDPGEEGLPGMHAKVEIRQPIVAPQNGYIYVWVSNESENTKVWFDDLQITHTQTMVTQATDYGVWGDVLREQKTDESKYRYAYQGQYSERDEETNWNHFELREYDPVIGRWLIPDPMREHWSPYVAMGNNPVNLIDPNGGNTEPKIGDIKDGMIYTENGWGPLSRHVVVEAPHMPFNERISQYAPIVQDVTNQWHLNVPIGLKRSQPTRETGFGLMIWSTGADETWGGSITPGTDPAAESFDLIWLNFLRTNNKGLRGRNEEEFGIIEKQNEQHSAVHKPDTTIVVNDPNRYQAMIGAKLGAPYYKSTSYRINKASGDTLEIRVQRTYTGKN